MTFASANEPFKSELCHSRPSESMADTYGEPVEEHIWPESNVVGARGRCPGTLELVLEPWYGGAATDRSGLTTINTLGLPGLDITSPSTSGAPDTDPKSSNMDEKVNCDTVHPTCKRCGQLGQACSYSLRKKIRRKTKLRVCVECRRQKKKCNRARPICSRCSKSGTPCYYLSHSQNSSGMSVIDSQSTTSEVDGQPFTPLTQTMPHEMQQSPGQQPSAPWETLVGAAAIDDSSVTEVHASMKPTLLGYSNLPDDLGESTLHRSITSGADCFSISDGPQPWFVGEPSHVFNSDVVLGSYVIFPSVYVEEFYEFTRNKSVRKEGLAYGGGVNTFAQVVQSDDREFSLWSPLWYGSTTAPGSLLAVATPTGAAIPPTTLSDPWSFEPTDFHGLESSQPFHPVSVSPFGMATYMHSTPCRFPQGSNLPLDSADTSTI